MKICIYGAGAIGTWLGARLGDPTKHLGHHISVVARGATLSALQHQGLRLQPVGAAALADAITAPVTARADPADLGVQDLIILTVKAPAMREVAQHIAPLVGPNTVVLPAMNGVPWWFLQGFGGAFADTPLASVDAGGAISRAIPADQVLGCVVHASCSMLAPGVARQHFGNKLILGEPAGHAASGASRRLQAVTQAFEAAGIDITVSAQIQHDVWFKLWGNMSVNPVSALTGATTDLILDDPLVREFISSVMREAKAIGARLGIALDQDPEDRHQVTLKLGAFKTSMLQDVEASRAVELDALVSAVRELGGITEVATPFTDALLGLARLHARVRGLY